jgi:tRNA (guanine-N7-)-methyltransferase
MGKDKLKRFAEMEHFERVIQPQINYHSADHELKGRWATNIFKNNNPIILEIGCGRGEYTVELAKRNPQFNFIGIDIKGARIWKGAKIINEEQILNAAFLRIRMETIEKFFSCNEVSQIWVTFPDPQPKESKENKRLTAPIFLNRYKNLLKPEGIIHLKTDNKPLFDYTLEIIQHHQHQLIYHSADLYHEINIPIDRDIQTTYEKRYLALQKPICYIQFSLRV